MSNSRKVYVPFGQMCGPLHLSNGIWASFEDYFETIAIFHYFLRDSFWPDALGCDLQFLYRINAGINAIFSHLKLLKEECSGDKIYLVTT